jgi:hypothetical protein
MLDFVRKTGHQEPARRQRIEVREFFHLPITDIAPGLVPFPNDRGITVSGKPFASVFERRIQLQASVPTTRTPRSNRYRVAYRPMPTPASR